MAMQLRVKHALGVRTMQVEDRSAQRPITVGRDATAEVQIPSSAVAPTHCRLYRREDQWILEDCDTASGTFVNGQRIKEPVYVQSGDVITLGPGQTARIDIDPMGLMRTKGPARPAAPAAAAAVSQPLAEDESANPADEAGAYGQAGPELMSGGDSQQESAWPAQPLGGGAGWPARTPRSRRHKRSNNARWVALGVTLSVVVVFAAVFIAIAFRPKDEAKAPPPPSDAKKPDDKPAQPPVDDVKRKKSIFDDGKAIKAGPDSGRTERPVVAPRVQNTDPTPAGNPTPTQAQTPAEAPKLPADPRKQTDEWKDLERANAGANYARAIWMNEDYRQRHAGEFDDELKKKTADALDSLWWQRVADLCETRDRLTKELAKLVDDIRIEPDAEFKKKLEREKKSKEELLASVRSRLVDEMGYTSAEAPNPYDGAQLARLRTSRDSGKFEKWSEMVVKYIRSQNGALPWQHR